MTYKERLRQDTIDHNGTITFGTKAMPLPLDAHVDVLVYNDGMSIRATIFLISRIHAGVLITYVHWLFRLFLFCFLLVTHSTTLL